LFWYILFKNEFQGRGLRSRLPKRNQKIKVEIEISERNRKTSEFGQNHHKSEKRLEISKCRKEIRKKKIRILEMSERNQKRKSEKKVRNVRKEIRKASTWWRFYLMVHVHSCGRREKKNDSCSKLKNNLVLVLGFSFVPVHVSFFCRACWKIEVEIRQQILGFDHHGSRRHSGEREQFYEQGTRP
jgi:hypothetical protein